MRVLIIDAEGAGLDFAMRCMEHGHEVKTFVRDKDRLNGSGLITKVPNWEMWMQWADVILPTGNDRYLDRLDYFHKLGYPIFGPTKQSAMLEIDRKYGMDVLKKAGVPVPEYQMFKNLSQAEAHCWKKDRRYVFKTLGSEEDKSLSYVAKDSADMINTFHRWKKTGQAQKSECMLQEFIPGVEFGVSAWMGSDGFLSLRGENVEHKKLMSGNYGPNTGEMGTLMWYTDKSKLFDEVLKPMEKFLLSIGHRGDIDLNCIIDENGKPWVLEWTSRLGWPAFYIMCAQHDEPVEWMRDAMNGHDTLKASTDPHIGLVCTLPPFPNNFGQKDQTVGIPIQGITDKNWPHLHLCNAMAGKGVEIENGKPVMKDILVTSGQYVFVASGSGKTIRYARKKAYQIADEITLPNKQVRDDVGEKFMEQLPDLQKHGFATGVTA